MPFETQNSGLPRLVPTTVFKDEAFELSESDVCVFVMDNRQHKVVTMPPAVWRALVKAWWHSLPAEERATMKRKEV